MTDDDLEAQGVEWTGRLAARLHDVDDDDEVAAGTAADDDVGGDDWLGQAVRRARQSAAPTAAQPPAAPPTRPARIPSGPLGDNGPDPDRWLRDHLGVAAGRYSPIRVLNHPHPTG